jgi:ketosteroid isomerase-like protein
VDSAKVKDAFMIYLLVLLPATGLTIGGYVALFLSGRTTGGMQTFGRYLGFWAFTLAALLILGAIFAAAHCGHRCPIWMHERMHRTPSGGGPPASVPLVTPNQTIGNAADAVRDADAAWLKVYAAKDLEKSVAFLDEQASMLAPNAPVATGKAAIAKVIAADFAYGDGIWHADKAGVSQSGDLGYTSGPTSSSFKDSSGKLVTSKGNYLTVWKKQTDGSWKVLFDMFNLSPP